MSSELFPQLVSRHAQIQRIKRQAIVVTILVGAVGLFIWHGFTFFARLGDSLPAVVADLKMTATTLTLNVALILFGWRYYVDVQQEIQRRIETERQAERLASTDGMTGLLNRKGYSEAGAKLEAEMGEDEELVCLSIQLNRFKTINDRYGFDIGDEMLRRLARQIDAETGDNPVARVSGDEFAALCIVPKGATDEIDAIGARLLEAATRPMQFDDRMVQCGAHVGIAAAPGGELGPRDLLRRADIALATAKVGRLARPVWFDESMERELLAESEIEQGIRSGIETDRFFPYFEPQVDLSTGRVKGFEVLARWKHPIAGIVTPDRFIPVAEEHHLIGDLTQNVFRRAMEAAQQWPERVDLSINIAPSQLADSWLAQKLVRLLVETGFPADRLVVEITEGSLFADIEMARTIVTSLKNQGIRIALDDFGTGFSSLSHLRALPFDLIKVDRSFTATMHEDRESRAIVHAVAMLSDALDIPVVVEGIETAKAHAAVLGMGCAYGQGWYFGKPMTADQAEQVLRQRSETEDLPLDHAVGE